MSDNGSGFPATLVGDPFDPLVTGREGGSGVGLAIVAAVAHREYAQLSVAEIGRKLVKGGATQAQAQEHIEEQVEWFTDLFYDGLSPEEAAKEALA